MLVDHIIILAVNLKFLILDGYRTIAVEQVIAETNVENKKKKKKGESRESNDIVPSPIEFTKNKVIFGLSLIVFMN